MFVTWIENQDTVLVDACMEILELDCRRDACAMNPMSLEVNKIKDEDCGLANGGANAVVSGGTMPYTFEWSNGADSSRVDSLAFGTHYVTVTDGSGCIAVGQVDIGFTDLFLISQAVVLNDECGHPASIDLELMGGVMPFSYQWSNGSTDASQDSLLAGIYGVTVTDANGCQTSSEYEVTTGPDTLSVNLVTTDDFCEFDAVPQNGRAPYDYFWSNQSTSQQSGPLVIGEEYVLFISDADGCASTVRFTAEIGLAAADFTFMEDGLTVQFEGTGETSGHIWDFGNGFTSNLRSPEFVYTSAGTYTVRHITENSCGRDTAMAELTVMDPVSSESLEMVRNLSLFPNPTAEKLNIRIETEGRWEGDLLIYNLLGQRVYEAMGESIDQQYLKEVDVSNLPPSTYMLAVRIDGRMVLRKFIVQRH